MNLRIDSLNFDRLINFRKSLNIFDLKSNQLYLYNETNSNQIKELFSSIKQLFQISIDDFQIANNKNNENLLILRLLHIFGPYNLDKEDNENNDDIILIAECLNEQSNKNLLICIKNIDDNNNRKINVSFDQINQIFSLKNFLTIDCPTNLSFIDSYEINCQISSKSFFDIAIIVSTVFDSILEFNIFPDIYENLFNDQTNMEQQKDNNDSLMDTSDVDFENIELNCEIQTPEVKRPINTIYASSDNDNQSTTLTPVDYTSRSTKSTRSEHESNDNLNENKDKRATINKILSEIENNELKEKFNIQHLLDTNINETLIQEESIQLKSLSELSNEVSENCFVNIVGIIKQYEYGQLMIYDEKIERIDIYMDYLGIDYYKSSSSSSSTTINNNLISSKCYPSLNSGDIVCIRQLCLTSTKYICPHPDQIVLINLNYENDKIVTDEDKKISLEELKRICELYCFHIDKLIHHNECIVKNINNQEYSFINIVGLILAQISSNNPNKQYLDIYLLLPTPTNYVTSIPANVSFLFEKIKYSTFHPNRIHYDENYIKQLRDNNQIISVSIWGNHRKTFETLLPLDAVLIYNVSVRKNRSNNGFYYYQLSEGSIYGRRCLSIKKHTIFDEYLQKYFLNLKKNLKKIIQNEQDDMYAEQILDNFDTTTRSRLMNDSNAKQLIINMKGNDEINQYSENESWKLINLKYKNIFSCIKMNRTLFQPFVNVDLAKKIDNFNDLKNEILKMYAEDLNKQQQQHQQEKIDETFKLFKISARLIDYQFEDNNGNEFINMSHLRQNLMKFVCTNQSCDFISPFISFISSITTATNSATSKTNDCFSTSFLSSSLNAGIDKKNSLICQKCKSSTISIYFYIKLLLEDDEGNILSVLISTPEIEELIRCTNEQLIYTDPLSDDIINIIHYILKTLCPFRSFLLSSSKDLRLMMRRKKSQTLQSTTASSPTATSSNNDNNINNINHNSNQINPKFDWILQPIFIHGNDTNDLNIYNIHLFDLYDFNNYNNNNNDHYNDSLNTTTTTTNKKKCPIFYIRSINIYE